jgi:hypothetical protein
LLLAQPAFADSPRDGTFKAVQGEVSVLQDTARRPALPGGGLVASERVVTGPDGAAALTLRDGTVLTVGPATTLHLSRFQFEPTRQEGSLLVNLLQGSIRMVTGLLGKLHPEQVQVITPTLVVGVRGTDFIVEAP